MEKIIIKDISTTTYTFYSLTVEQFNTLFKKLRVRDYDSEGLPFKLSAVVMIGKVAEVKEEDIAEVCGKIPPHDRYGLRFGWLYEYYTFKKYMKDIGNPEYGCIVETKKKPVKYEDIDK